MKHRETNDSKKPTQYSPIVIFAYNRYNRFCELVDSLLKNDICEYSDLFIFIDGIKDEKDRNDNEKIKELSLKIKGFNKVEIICSAKNKGLANSIIEGVSEVISKYDKVIVLEDDLVVSNKFLKYMNEALDYYKDDKRIFSIAGYCPNISINNDDVFFYPRIESWGWGTWIDRWSKVDWNVSDYEEIKNDQRIINDFNKGGNDLFDMLRKQRNGLVNSWAIRFCYAEFKDKSYTVYPPKSLIANNGCDETGTNFKEKNDRYKVILVDDYIPNFVNYEGTMNNYRKMLSFYNCKRPIDIYGKIKRKVLHVISKI